MATSILKNAIHSSLARTLLDEILSKKNKYYYTFGKTDPWDLAETPQSAVDTLEYEYTARSNIILCQEILSNDVCLVIDRINWVLGAVYDQYDNYSETNVAFSGATSLETANFYILTDEFNVYKCISNNKNSASAVKPTGQSSSFINIPEDGYVWKFMYNIPLYLRNKFLNSSQMPVVNALQTGYYSDGRLSQVIFSLKGTKYHENISLGSVATKTVSGVTNLRKLYGTNSAILSLVATDRIEVNGEVRSVASVATEVVESVTYYVITTANNEPLLRVTNLSAAKKLNTELEIIGDGYRQANPYIMTSITVSDGGSGFSSPDNLVVNFPAPLQAGSTASGTVTVNVNITGLDLTAAGSGYVETPSVTISSGGGTGAIAAATLGYPISSTISVPVSGSGYSLPPTISFNGGDGTGAAAVARLSGTIQSIDFTGGTTGEGYDTAPSITIGAQWAQNIALAVDQQVAHNGNLYTVTVAGTTGSTAPTHTTGSVTNGTATLTYAGAAASGIVTILNGLVQSVSVSGGSGYLYIPSVTFSGGTPDTPASGTAIMNASVASITVTNTGSGYTSTPLVVITPYGADVGSTIIPAEATASLSPINASVKSLSLTNAGQNYTSLPTVTINAPRITFNGSTAVSAANNTITYNNHGMQTGASVVYSNGGGTTIPGLTNSSTYYVNAVSTSVIKLYNSQANAITGGATGLIDITSTGVGASHTLTNTTAGLQATANAVISSGFIKSATITDAGYGYTVIPTPYLTFTNGWVAGAIVTLNQEVSYQNRIYKVTAVTNPYALGTTAPTHTTGDATNGDVTLTYISTAIMPVFQATAQKSKAYIDPIIDTTNGEIKGAIIIDGGTGYTSALCSVKRNKPPTSGTGIDAQLLIDTSIGAVNSIQAQVELSAVNGSLDNIKIIDAGVGYVQSNTTVKIEGDGVGATATATVANGNITKINIVTRGKDYTNANVTIIGDGSGAVADAVIGPIGGHGKSSIDELFGRTIIMYNRLPSIKIKSVSLDPLTSIRQTGVLKSPNQFNSVFNYNSFSGSTCYKITVSSTPTTIALNSIVTVYTTQTPTASSIAIDFRVIAKSGNSLILQAIDNNDEQVVSGNFIRSTTGVYHTITYVEKPDVDRFSGDLIFIDNKTPFAPTDEQPLVITTRFKL